MFDIDLWREIFQSINKNRTRSLLSGFTVTFTILFGLANGLNNTFAEAFVDDAANAMFIRSGTTTKAHKGMQAGRRIQFKNEDYKYIKTDFDDNVEFITSRIYKNVNASYRNEKNNYSLRAVHPDHQYLEKTKVYQGRYINQRDMEIKTKVVVIGKLVKEDLFLKVHRSFIINTKKIIDIEDNSVLIGNNVIPVSRSNRPELMQRLNLL